nr:copper homeostasis protein CutC [uncultured Cetobacterium sp.]
MGKVIAICISENKGTEKVVVESGVLIENFGLEKDAHGGNWHRQISLLELEKIDDFNNKGGNVNFGAFGENLIIQGIDLKNLAVGSILQIGTSLLEITQKGKQCHHHCKIYHRVGDCIMPREGVFAKVLKGGVIFPNDEIKIIKSPITLEACVGSYSEAIAAINKGANRVELCENLFEGGTTPSYGTIKKVRELAIPAFVMIRPRGGDFCYSQAEIEIMKEDIKICKELGVLGVVFGVLTKDNKIDYSLLKELVELSKPMSITFHKAIDEIESPENEILTLAEIGVDRILTSGKKATAFEGAELLNKFIKIAKDKIKIIVCGGVTSDNFQEINKLIPSTEYHGKKIV